MPRVGFEHTIPAFERLKTVHALDRAATVIGPVSSIYHNLFGVMTCSLMDVHFCLEDVGSRFLRNVRNVLRGYTVFKPEDHNLAFLSR
jgi:hypothetical protein